AYADCADAGLDGVVSVHLSSALSGTVSVGRKKAEEAPLRVNVVDSHQVGGGLAITALAAQRAADRGESLEAVTAVAESVAAAVQTFVVVDTLEYLKKGGRLSSGRAAVGNMLRVKPILHVEGGRVELLEQTRTWSRALRRLVELMVDALAGEPADVIVSHALAPDHAADLWSALDDAIEVRAGLETIIGPIVGAHTGPGAVGVAVVPATLAG
ncbi:MAG TPA: DegV family protein, partial [Nitriliruptorales bacterium]